MAILYKNIDTLITMDRKLGEVKNGALVVEGNIIHNVGSSSNITDQAFEKEVDLSGYIVMPGLINTHHHMYQSMTRAVPGAQDATLFQWLQTLYPIWAEMGEEEVYVASKLAMAELLLSGCTTSSDHLYLFPNGVKLENTIDAAQEMGMRFVATRGSMSIGRSKGGLPPDHLVESEEAILLDSERVINKFHQSNHGAMVQIGLAPCSPFSVSQELMRTTARLARKHQVRLHTHLAENQEDCEYSMDKFGMTPIEYAEHCEWLGEDVWLAHCVKLDQVALEKMADTGTSVAHCPCSNMRLGSGIAPVKEMLQKQVRVGLGVDGSASNDAGNMINEARQAMLLQRVLSGPQAFSARQALELATVGGAETLGRRDVGRIFPGMVADFIAFKTDQVSFSGSWDEMAALVLCNAKPERVVCNGETIVEDYRLKTIDQEALVREHQRLAKNIQASLK